jgi:choloylglycine hydrolase
MCTAITYRTKDHYFGRTLDLECSYQECVTITPRNFPFVFRRMGSLSEHYALIGMAAIAENYPLYYEATNEKGLSIAGLNFPGNAVYQPETPGLDNLAPFELIPWILGQCSCIGEARKMLEKICLADIPFSKELPLSPLHWIVSDSERSIVAEPLKDGLKLCENPFGVLTNNPPFGFHQHNLQNYAGLTPLAPVNRFSPKIELGAYSRGMGAIGLPGDVSSASRFVRAAFNGLNSVSGESESQSVSQFFHILGSVEQIRGCVRLEDGQYVTTVYTCCCNTTRGIYYYTTYDNQQICAVDLHRENLGGAQLVSYPLIKEQQIFMQNR